MKTWGQRNYYKFATNSHWSSSKGNRDIRLANEIYFNPWYKEPALGMLGWGLGVINPLDNKIPFIPWL